MYKLNVAYDDYAGRARRATLAFNLDTREIYKLLPELKSIFEWLQSVQPEGEEEKLDPRDLDTEEVRDFYNNLERIILDAWGEMSEDGEHFRKSGKFDFEESKAFSACMDLFVFQPQEAVKLVNALLPKDLFDKVKNASPEELAASTESKLSEKDEEIARLRRQIDTGVPQS